jgi:hypothetical protein
MPNKTYHFSRSENVLKPLELPVTLDPMSALEQVGSHEKTLDVVLGRAVTCFMREIPVI